jgi:hypothetical protein
MSPAASHMNVRIKPERQERSRSSPGHVLLRAYPACHVTPSFPNRPTLLGLVSTSTAACIAHAFLRHVVRITISIGRIHILTMFVTKLIHVQLPSPLYAWTPTLACQARPVYLPCSQSHYTMQTHSEQTHIQCISISATSWYPGVVVDSAYLTYRP